MGEEEEEQWKWRKKVWGEKNEGSVAKKKTAPPLLLLLRRPSIHSLLGSLPSIHSHPSILRLSNAFFPLLLPQGPVRPSPSIPHSPFNTQTRERRRPTNQETMGKWGRNWLGGRPPKSQQITNQPTRPVLGADGKKGGEEGRGGEEGKQKKG
jgi:hypothetical protein